MGGKSYRERPIWGAPFRNSAKNFEKVITKYPTTVYHTRPVESHSGARENIFAGPPNILDRTLRHRNFVVKNANARKTWPYNQFCEKRL